LVQFPLLDVLTAPSHLRASMIARGILRGLGGPRARWGWRA
jgi:hypothetical protein